jgi:hypothetical protein
MYEFQCHDCGFAVERPFPGGKAPGIGEKLCDCTRLGCTGSIVRVVSLPHVPPDSLSVDPDNVPIQHRVASNDGFGIGEKAARKREKAYEESMQVKRAMAHEAKGSGKSVQMEHSIPPELYHGKIKETGDRTYWDDPKNRKRHPSTKVGS